jgi:hypothetical protein
MRPQRRLGLLASAIALALAYGPTAWAETQSANEAPAAEAAPPTDQTQPPAPAEADPRARIEQRRAEAMAERERRYEELRAQAAEVGIDLPAAPPWAQTRPQPPAMPDMPQAPQMPDMPEWPAAPGMPPSMMERPGMAPPASSSRAEWDEQREARWTALRERAAEKDIELPEKPLWQLTSPEERQAHAETMRNLTPEQRRTLHALRWEMMRAQAAERGMELPESPPWEQMMKEREAMQERWKGYRETVEAMTPEQREAAAAIFGSPFGPDGDNHYGAGPGSFQHPPMMPPQGGPGYDQGMPPSHPGLPGHPQGPTPPYGSGY